MVNFLAILGAYLLGSLSFAAIVSRCMRLPDPHLYGSGNPGATNVLRSGKKLAAALTLFGDAAKGWLAVWGAMYIQHHYQANIMIALVAIAVLLGHMLPIFFHFKGGKGVATAVGILLALSWPTAVICGVVWLIMAFVFKVSSLAALVATILSPIIAWFFMPINYWYATIVIAILVLYRHKSNIIKLIRGTESKIGSGIKPND